VQRAAGGRSAPGACLDALVALLERGHALLRAACDRPAIAPPALVQDYKEQCVQYVQMYGVMLINLAINYLQPDQVCTALGYCTAQSA
jgi:hypothetical protein